MEELIEYEPEYKGLEVLSSIVYMGIAYGVDWAHCSIYSESVSACKASSSRILPLL